MEEGRPLAGLGGRLRGEQAEVKEAGQDVKHIFLDGLKPPKRSVSDAYVQRGSKTHSIHVG